MKSIKTIAGLATAGFLLLGVPGCGDLPFEPRSTVSEENIFTDPGSYRAFLAKLYAGLVTTGQAGPAGDPDIRGIDEGFSQYVRGYWQLQELPTDEAIIGWGDIGLPELNTQGWSDANPFVTAMYARIFYQVAVANQFLRETTADKLAARGVSAELTAEIQQYRAEARFLRALSYWHALDLFGNVPIVDENFDITQLPEQAMRADVFGFVEDELLAIRDELPLAGEGDYGRADQGAVNMVLAKLYLNAEVYTGAARWADARMAAAAVIGSNAYSLDPNYADMFLADNHTSPELIFTVPQDGDRTRTYGGMTYLVHASVGGGMDPADFGIDFAWWGLRLRSNAVDRYEGGPGGPDQRASLIFTTGQQKATDEIGNFFHGYALGKYKNITSTGAQGKHPEFPDTDYPMFRLADAYLIYAEAVVRGNETANMATAVNYVNLIRRRAYGDTSGDIMEAELTAQFILDERSRELLWEGHRRQDLIRFGQFTTAGIWQWKGGEQAGTTTDDHLNLYPIPANELAANPNLDQNPEY